MDMVHYTIFYAKVYVVFGGKYLRSIHGLEVQWDGIARLKAIESQGRTARIGRLVRTGISSSYLYGRAKVFADFKPQVWQITK